MRRALTLSLALLGCAAPRPIDPRIAALVAAPADPARVRVLTMNAHRFFDTTCDSPRCGGSAYEALPTQRDFDAQADRLALAVARAQADAACVQEVESDDALDALRARLGPGYRTAVLGEIGAPGSVDVAVLSRDRALEVRRHRDRRLALPTGRSATFSRELLEVHLDHHGRRVILLCAHFRSKVRDDPDRRAAEGATAAMVVAEAVRAHPGALVLLAGDLNDVPGSEALRALEGVPMERAAATLGEGGDITWRGAAGAFALDHILRATAGGGRLAPGGVTVLRDGDGGYGGSDHAALRAEFALE